MNEDTKQCGIICSALLLAVIAAVLGSSSCERARYQTCVEAIKARSANVSDFAAGMAADKLCGR